MINWNDTSAEKEKSVLKLFKEYGITVTLGKYSNDSSHQYTFAELSNIDNGIVKDGDIISRMLNVNSLIATRPLDSVLGDFLYTTVKDELIDDEPVGVTYDDLYIYLRAILKRRRAKREVRDLDWQIAQEEATIAATKTVKEKRADAKERLKALKESKKNLK